jgi:hypothetical protein
LQQCQGQVRTAGMGGVVGIDLMAVLTVAEAIGYDLRAMALLVPAVEAGMVTGYRKLDEQTADSEE